VALQLATRGRATSVVCLAPAGGWRAGGPFDRYLAVQFGFAYRVCRALLAPRRRRMLERRGVRRALLRSMVAEPDQVSNETFRTIVSDIAGCDALALSLRSVLARDLSTTAEVTVPVLIAWSEHDRILVSRASRDRLVRQVGRPEVTTLAGCGHVPMSDAPELVARTIIEFTGRARPVDREAPA
jgi:pimeloyl-ACP methyl ester carboxylesterase